ncbi:hypothetical protein BS78_05G054100 [Paspalum vaginatum]|nr:hypothetical protein BS78_05G054100 [Paspalum vaginatum]
MEPAAAWLPCNLQLENWVAGVPAAWSSPRFPAASESTVKYGNWIQTCVPNNNSSGRGQQLVEYYAAATQHYSYPVENDEAQAESVIEVVLDDFRDDIDMMKEKMHRFPESIRDLGDWYTVPRTVAIGPYHHDRPELKKAEQVKHVASCRCIRESSGSMQEVYDAVVSAAADARRLYDRDVMAAISGEDFQHMMFFDACFLVQYMAWLVSTVSKNADADPWLAEFFYSNRSGIHHDVWLLENQLPWKVVESVMNFRPVDLEKFVGEWVDSLHDRQDLKEKSFALDDDDRDDPPHLLGLLRHYIVRSTRRDTWNPKGKDEFKSLSFSVSAIELAKIGITLTVNETAKLLDMGINNNNFSAELSLAPLSLNYARASRLVNMAALEICCLTPSSLRDKIEDSAVCSYLLLLSMLAQKEEDVHELRRHGILEGGAGLTNKQVLDFFTCLQSLPQGLCSTLTMLQIENYKLNRKMLTKGHVFWYKNKKTIYKVLSAITFLVLLHVPECRFQQNVCSIIGF